MLQLEREIGPLETDAALLQDLADGLLRAVEFAGARQRRPARRQQRRLVAFVELIEDLRGRRGGRLQAEAVPVDRAHARRIVEDDRHGGLSPAADEAEVCHHGPGQPQCQQQQDGRADRHQQQVLDPLSPPRFLHAQLQKAQRRKRRVLRPAAVDQVQHDGNRDGQRGQQKQRRGETHGRPRLAT